MFGGGGGGLDSRKMQQMMQQMGIDIEDIDAEEVIIRTADEELVFSDAEVQRMDAQGQETYNIVGSPEHRDTGSVGAIESAEDSEEEADDDDSGIPDEDIALVADQAGVGKGAAREALEANNGIPADAIEDLL
jgi:nascent polypeptide-associated complex subunit alpha